MGRWAPSQLHKAASVPLHVLCSRVQTAGCGARGLAGAPRTLLLAERLVRQESSF